MAGRDGLRALVHAAELNLWPANQNLHHALTWFGVSYNSPEGRSIDAAIVNIDQAISNLRLAKEQLKEAELNAQENSTEV